MAESSNQTGSITIKTDGGEVSGYAKVTMPDGVINALYSAKGEGAMIQDNGKTLTLDEQTVREVVAAIQGLAAKGPLVEQSEKDLSNLVADIRDNGKLDKSGQTR